MIYHSYIWIGKNEGWKYLPCIGIDIGNQLRAEGDGIFHNLEVFQRVSPYSPIKYKI